MTLFIIEFLLKFVLNRSEKAETKLHREAVALRTASIHKEKRSNRAGKIADAVGTILDD
jgi:hypothetical protein